MPHHPRRRRPQSKSFDHHKPQTRIVDRTKITNINMTQYTHSYRWLTGKIMDEYSSLCPSLSLSLYRAWGRQQRPGCLPRADTHTRVPWQVVSSPRAFRTEGLGCTRNGLTKRKGKEKACSPPLLRVGYLRRSWAGLKTNLSLPLQIQIWGALKRNKDYGPGWAQV